MLAVHNLQGPARYCHKEGSMSNAGTDQAEQENQRDQAEGERDDEMEQNVTRGAAGGDQSTHQQTPAERDPAEGSRREADV